MANKVEEARQNWETESSEIQQRNKNLLLEFGLNPMQIWHWFTFTISVFLHSTVTWVQFFKPFSVILANKNDTFLELMGVLKN